MDITIMQTRSQHLDSLESDEKKIWNHIFTQETGDQSPYTFVVRNKTFDKCICTNFDIPILSPFFSLQILDFF